MRRHLAPLILAAFAWSGVAAAQDMPVDIPDSLASADSIASAAKTLQEAGTDKLLVKDLIGKELTGSDGNTVGTIENLAVIPGGRLVAALVSLADGTTIAVPYAAIKVANAAGTAGLSLPVSASEIHGMGELKSLAGAMKD